MRPFRDLVVIFTSDHGDCLSDHGQSQKWTMDEQVTRVLVIVWSPKCFPAGKSVDELVQQVGIAPTILDWQGSTSPSRGRFFTSSVC